MAEKKNIGKSKKLMDFLWEWGAKIISYTDLALDKTGDFFEESWEEIMEIAGAGIAGAIDVGAALIRWYDNSSEIVEWFVKKTAVLIMRKYHDLLIDLAQYRKIIIRDCIIVLLVWDI